MNATAPLELRNLLMGSVLTQAVQTAAELGVADALAHCEKDSAALASELHVAPAALQRLLRTLASHGVFAESAAGRFANSKLSEHLRSDHPQSLRGLALAYGDSAIWRAWEGLSAALRDGGSAFEHVHKAPLFEHLKQHPTTARRFDAAMASSANMINDALTKSYDWNRCGTIVDIGGGSGATLIRILSAAPRARGIVFDLPHAAATAARHIAGSPVAERCSSVAGDFFSWIPDAGDTYLLKHILHDWDDETCIRLLGRCRRALPPQARLLVCERVLSNETNQRYAKLTDLVMLALTQNGRERTEPEYAALYHAAGFRLLETSPVADELSLMQLAAA